MAALPADTTCAAWARFFFAGTDEAVQQYVCQSLLAAVEEGDSLSELAPVLQDFRPPAASQAALLDCLRELESALQQPREEQQQLGCQYRWLEQQEAAALETAAVAANQVQQPNEPAAATHDEQRATTAAAAGGTTIGQPRHAASRGSGLSFAAVEFKPAGTPAASLAAGLGSLQLGGDQGGIRGCGAAAAAAEPASGWEEQQQCAWPGSDGGWDPAAARAAEPAADAGDAGERVAGGPAAEAAFLAVLGEQFPLFSEVALSALFAEQKGSLAATIHTLCSLEAELEGQAAAYVSPPQQTADPSFTADDFPTLGGPSNRSSIATACSARGGAAYASRARAAAALPDQPARRAASRPRPTAAAAVAPAPIWQQSEGVQRFATGAAAAQEYAQLRADARDHARLRNACFQQATQAYLAGNRALAKELGAKGRWHGEQMHAAHASAAADIFARRNTAAAASIGGGSGGMQTVDLHGLHVTEALDVLEEMLLRLQGSGARRLRVVVGVGSHGAVPARLPQGVKRWLQDQGLPFSEPYAGLLEIRLGQ